MRHGVVVTRLFFFCRPDGECVASLVVETGRKDPLRRYSIRKWIMGRAAFFGALAFFVINYFTHGGFLAGITFGSLTGNGLTVGGFLGGGILGALGGGIGAIIGQLIGQLVVPVARREPAEPPMTA